MGITERPLAEIFNPLVENGKKIAEIAVRLTSVFTGEVLFSKGLQAMGKIPESILNNPEPYILPVAGVTSGVALFSLGAFPREITRGMNRILGMN